MLTFIRRVDLKKNLPLSQHPQNIAHTGENQVELACLRGKVAFSSIAEFQNDLYRIGAPRVHAHVDQVKYRLLAHDPQLRDIFPGSAFHAAEWFLGSPESAPRLEDLEFVWAWRGTTMLGRYGHRWGGELILWEERKVIELPVGSTFLFPTAFTRYSFTEVRAGESQYAFSQYSLAAPFRYVDNGFKSEKAFEERAWARVREARQRRRDARMTTALSMYSTLSELQEEEARASSD
ncbi:hypothetical protein C8R43DRAFT_878930 [Mycena crocata]|nr:hypothetical protein C8R43DRAFT_878930 [Mycena crocata]